MYICIHAWNEKCFFFLSFLLYLRRERERDRKRGREKQEKEMWDEILMHSKDSKRWHSERKKWNWRGIFSLSLSLCKMGRGRKYWKQYKWWSGWETSVWNGICFTSLFPSFSFSLAFSLPSPFYSSETKERKRGVFSPRNLNVDRILIEWERKLREGERKRETEKRKCIDLSTCHNFLQVWIRNIFHLYSNILN